MSSAFISTAVIALFSGSNGLQLSLSDAGMGDGDDDTLYVWDSGFVVADAKLHKKGAVIDSFVDEGRTDNIVLVPDAKFAYCYIPKVACYEFNSMINGANGLGAYKQIFGTSTIAAMHLTREDITKHHGWSTAYFVRDPLSRYLSAFGSKCLPGADGKVEGNGKDCLGDMIDRPFKKSEAIELFEARVLSDARRGRPVENEHWMPQYEILTRCGLAEFGRHHVDFKGTLSGDVHHKVKQMLKTVNVSNATKLADEYFPPRNISGHSSATHDTLDDFYKDKSIKHAVKNLYSIDYEKLTFSD